MNEHKNGKRCSTDVRMKHGMALHENTELVET